MYHVQGFDDKVAVGPDWTDGYTVVGNRFNASGGHAVLPEGFVQHDQTTANLAVDYLR